MNTNMFASNKKGSTVLVYPANGYKGYAICKQMANKSHHHYNDQKMEAKEVLAVCCGTGGMYEKLKNMGHPIKVIVLDDASSMSEWKKEMKGRKCDIMMICTDGVPHHHSMGSLQRDPKDELKMYTKSLENAVEMSSHMSCKGIVVSAAFCAEESKYKFCNHMYKAIEKTVEKHFKGECAVLFNNMIFEVLYLSKKEIMDENTLSWPVSEDAKACSMAVSDYARCCMEVMCKMMKGNKTMSHRHKKYHLTGCDKLTPREMIEMMSDSLNMEINYNEVDQREWKRMMEEEQMLSPMQIQISEEIFEMMKNGCFKKCTDECKKLIGRKPMDFEEWLEKHRGKFEGQNQHRY